MGHKPALGCLMHVTLPWGNQRESRAGMRTRGPRATLVLTPLEAPSCPVPCRKGIVREERTILGLGSGLLTSWGQDRASRATAGRGRFQQTSCTPTVCSAPCSVTLPRSW